MQSVIFELTVRYWIRLHQQDVCVTRLCGYIVQFAMQYCCGIVLCWFLNDVVLTTEIICDLEFWEGSGCILRFYGLQCISGICGGQSDTEAGFSLSTFPSQCFILICPYLQGLVHWAHLRAHCQGIQSHFTYIIKEKVLYRYSTAEIERSLAWTS
jgi:hypothetical protein